jgi:hypothetical protein
MLQPQSSDPHDHESAPFPFQKTIWFLKKSLNMERQVYRLTFDWPLCMRKLQLTPPFVAIVAPNTETKLFFS